MIASAARTSRIAVAKSQGTLALLSQTGSRAYGTNHEDSDWDFKGIYVASMARMFSLGGAQQTVTPDSVHDIVIYELAHFCKLAAAANPTVLEILWSDSFEASHIGERLRLNRDLFLSKRVLQTYGGYAKSQVQKALAGTGGSRGADHYKRHKFRLHTVRLLHSGAVALRDGRVPVRLSDEEIIWLNRVAAMPNDRFDAVVNDLFEAMDLMAERSTLPEKPDEAGIDRLMCSIRRSMCP